MSTSSTADARPTVAPPDGLAALDLFALGRQAAAARDARWNGRGFFVRNRQPETDVIVAFPFRLGESRHRFIQPALLRERNAG